jgi:D-alanine-D-alanine ligase
MRIGLAYDLKDAVTVPSGGPDDILEEYDSLETVDAIAAALESEGHSTISLGGGRDFLYNILDNEVDFVFNISEGLGSHRSREAQVPCVLDMLDIPYSGSDPQCLAICLDKPLTKTLVSTAGILTPKWELVVSQAQLAEKDWHTFPLPAFIKPACEGSSKGIRANARAESAAQVNEIAAQLIEQYGQQAIVEEFISGDELTVGILGNSPPTVLGIMRVLPKNKSGSDFVYSLEVKRDWERLVDYECPARLSADVLDKITNSSLKIFQTLGCRDFARLDFKLSCEGLPYFLEINPLAGLNPKSGDLPIMANKLGWSYQALISVIFNAALRRCPQCVRG